MGAILAKLWNDPAYFQKTLVFVFASVAVILPVLPLGEMGAVGYWLGKAAIPVAIALAARNTVPSGLTPDEADAFRRFLAERRGES